MVNIGNGQSQEANLRRGWVNLNRRHYGIDCVHKGKYANGETRLRSIAGVQVLGQIGEGF